MKRIIITVVPVFVILLSSGCKKSEVPEETATIDTTLDCKTAQETGAYTTFYKPQNGFVGDPMPFYNSGDGAYYLFFLYENSNNHPVYFTKTKDYATFESFGEILPAGHSGSQDEWIGTGSFVKKDNTYYCFYTGHNANLSPVEKVMTASSTDLKTWSKLPSYSFEAPSGYDKNNFRDPHVYFDETRNAYVMLVATRKDNRGVLARYVSDDLLQWQSIEPLTDLDTDAEILECPDIFKMGDKWYLVFSRINRDAHRKTFYRIADSPDGPWRICGDKSQNHHHETFDGLYLYAGKTASDGNNRYLSGWCSTGQEVNSNSELDWAGVLISHKLVQQSDGKLYPQIPEAVDKKFAQTVDFDCIKKTGNVTIAGNSFSINAGNAVFNRNTQPVKITMKIDASQADKNFGVAFGACDSQDDVYALTFDLTDNNHYRLPSIFMYHNTKELNFTPLTVPVNKIFDIKIIIEKSVCVTYINNNVAFSNRIYAMNQNPWMIFADEGTVRFSDIQISKQ
jgi:beta-fructofuranosidase